MASISDGDLNGDGDDEVVMLRDPIQPKTSLLMVNPAGAAMNPFEQASGNGSAAFKIVRTGDTDGDGRDEVVILKSDRYRIYTEPEVGGQATETTGAFYATAGVSNLPFMAVANVDGPGITQGPTLGVTPTTLSFSVDYGAVSPIQPLTITNVGSGSSFQWKAQIIEGSSWLLLDGQTGAVLRNTPGQVNVSVRTDAVDPGTYPGKIRVTTTDSNVANNTVDIPVTLVLRDPGFAASPSALTIWQKIGGNPPPPTVTSEVRIVRPVKATPWTATALSRDAAAVLMEKLAIGKATVATAGPIIDGVMVPPPDWLVFTPDHGTDSVNDDGVGEGGDGGRHVSRCDCHRRGGSISARRGSVGERDRHRRRPLQLHIPAAGDQVARVEPDLSDQPTVTDGPRFRSTKAGAVTFWRWTSSHCSTRKFQNQVTTSPFLGLMMIWTSWLPKRKSAPPGHWLPCSAKRQTVQSGSPPPKTQ